MRVQSILCLCVLDVALFMGGCACSPSTVADAAGAQETHALPVPLASPAGTQLLRRAEALDSFAMLVGAIETQANPAYCGVASAVIALNAIGINRPPSPEHSPYRVFTQDNFFSPAVSALLPATSVRAKGMTLDGLANALSTHPIALVVAHADDTTIGAFRRDARAALRRPDGVVLVNYYRPVLGQPGGGHISPIAAYDVHTDRFLVLDVARYRLPFVWVSTADLWSSMATIDPDSHRSRGFIIATAMSAASSPGPTLTTP